MNAPAWLTARPIAHRGLHDAARGIVENTLAAASAAIAGRYAIECDVQLAGDGEAVVFHDFTLERLTHASGRLDRLSAPALAAIALRNGDDKIAALPAFLDAVAARTPLIIEVKSAFDGDMRLAARTLEVLSTYGGAAAVKSFDPAIVAFMRAQGGGRPFGLVAQARYDDAAWPELSAQQRAALEEPQDVWPARPDFLSWHVGDLPHKTPEHCRTNLGMPVITWTVRSDDDRTRASQWADQIIFEGFTP